jgi:hypothetical protein
MATTIVNTGVSLPTELDRLISDAARGRQRADGGAGRASVSSLLAELIAKHRAELEADARRAPRDERQRDAVSKQHNPKTPTPRKHCWTTSRPRLMSSCPGYRTPPPFPKWARWSGGRTNGRACDSNSILNGSILLANGT